jgi:uncharacterized small protein (DUF1192 family)
MDISAVALSAVAALGTLTPLVLGLLNYIKDKKKDAAKPALPAPVLGETVDFESVAVQSLNAHIALLDSTVTELRERAVELKAQRDANAEALRAAGLPLPRV